MDGGNSRRFKSGIVIAGFGAGVIVAWLAQRERPPEPVAPEPTEAARAEPEPAPRATPPAPARRPPAPPAARPPSDEIITSDGLPIMPARGEPDGPVHPHPITPKHLHIYAENRLIGGIEGAMDTGDVPGMRRLLEQYRREYPEDDNQLQDGYEAIANCMEHPGASTRAAAERWLDQHNGSGAKRFVVRYCFENP